MESIFRKYIYLTNVLFIVSMLLVPGQLSAQHGWSVNPADYINSGDISGIVYFDGVLMTDGALGAFVNDTCRGFDDVAELAPSGHTIFQFLVYSNESAGETLTFRYYNATDGQVYDVAETLEFSNNVVHGNAINPIEFHAVTNDPPIVANPLADQDYDEYFNSSTLSIANLFSDKDGDALTYTVTSSDANVVTVDVTTTIVTIYEEGLGTATVTITASDGEYEVSDVIVVNVNNVNDPPMVVNPLSDKVYDEYFAGDTLELSQVFADKDGDELVLTASSDAPSIVNVSVDGTELVISEQGPGSAVITVTASDGSLEVSDQLNVTVNNVNDAPEVDNPVQDQELPEYFTTYELSLENVFSDKDGDVLTLSAVNSNPEVVTISLENFMLTITEQGLGTSTITLTASDGTLSVDASFIVRVNNVNDAPVVANPLPDRENYEYEGPFTIDLSSVFSDKDGDLLTLNAASSDTAVIRVSVSGTTLTINEVAPGSAVISVTATDAGTLSAGDSFEFTLINVNDAPEVVSPIPDLVLVDNIGWISFGLDTLFRDKDMDTLSYHVVVSDTELVSYTMTDSVLTFNALEVGEVEVILTASDTALSAVDTFNITVIEEVLLLVKFNGRRMQNRDTVDVCNPAGSVSIEVISSVDWGFVKVGNPSWLIASIEQDSSLNLSFSQHLLSRSRITEILIFDNQGHTFTFYLKQSDCTNSVEDLFARGLNMYPNPVEQLLIITNDNGMLNGAQLEIIDGNGRLLYLQAIEAGAGSTVEVDMSGYPEGMYYIRIRNEEGFRMDKIIKF